MKKKYALFMFGLIAVLFVCIAAWSQAEDASSLTSFYDAHFQKMAKNCKYKTDMKNSSIGAIRNAAVLSCLKTTYVMNHKDELIREMIAGDIGKKEHKIRKFITDKFRNFASVRGLNLKAQTPLAALPENPPQGFDKMPIAQFCAYFSVPVNIILAKLDKHRIHASENACIEDVAQAVGTSSDEVYKFFRKIV